MSLQCIFPSFSKILIYLNGLIIKQLESSCASSKWDYRANKYSNKHNNSCIIDYVWFVEGIKPIFLKRTQWFEIKWYKFDVKLATRRLKPGFLDKDPKNP